MKKFSEYFDEGSHQRKVAQDDDVEDLKGTQPAKYYKGDMKKSTKQARARHFAKGAKMDDDNPAAYKPAPGDKSAKTKPSKHTLKYKKMFGEEETLNEKIKGLEKKAKKSGISYGILKKVYDRGMAAWRTGHRPGTTPQQWAFARVNSMLTGGKADPDLQAKIRAGGYKKKKKKAKKEDLNLDEMQINRWYESIDTRLKYQLDHGDDWWWKMNEVHDKLLERFGYAQGCDIEDETPKKRMTMKEVALRNMWGEIDEAAEYNGRPVKLNNPTRGDVKKYKVYVKNDKGNVVKVEFGDPNMEIKRDDPARRKSFRARHNCDNPGPKYKARYWSCKFWEKGKSVTDLMKG